MKARGNSRFPLLCGVFNIKFKIEVIYGEEKN